MNLIIEKLIRLLEITDENANIYSAAIAAVGIIITIIGAVIAWWTIRDNRKSQREGHELLYQPNFEITDFIIEKRIGKVKDYNITENDEQNDNIWFGVPHTCGNPDCHKIHWFNIANKDSRFAAVDIKAGLFILNEDGKIDYNSQNWSIRNYLASGDSMQYSLPIDNIPFGRYFDHEHEKQYRFALLIDYKSEFSRKRYKRVYYIDGSSQSKNVQSAEFWTDAIYFFKTQEGGKTSKKTASKKARFISFVHRLLCLDFSINDWLNDFSKKGRKNEQ